jgi:FkbM family methyltransferase
VKIPVLSQLEKWLRFIRRNWPLQLNHAKLYYSQHGEDVFVQTLFGRKYKGFYVDVGAHHPFRYSNTAVFYKSGWRGINFEPLPDGYAALCRHRKHDINVNSAISEQSGEVPFAVSSARSGIMGKDYMFQDEQQDNVITVQSQPLHSLLDKYMPEGKSIDLMSVDCEGYDEMVLLSNNWEKYRPKVLLVEDHDISENTAIDRLLAERGYRFLARIGLTKAFCVMDFKAQE